MTAQGTAGGWFFCLLLSGVAAGLVLPLAAPPAFPVPSRGGEGSAAAAVLLPYLATGYRYAIVAHGAGTGFEGPGFDDSAFLLGDAGFGSRSGGCALNNPIDAATEWPIGTDVLLRREFDVPRGATGMTVGVAIDNDVQVFINGHDVSGGLRMHEGCATRDSFVFSVPDSGVHAGLNLLAVRGRDRGVLSYVDVEIAADIRPCPLSQGYWKNHPAAWPVASLTLGAESYDEGALLSILGTPTRGDASLILARQLIAAKLNVAGGSDSAAAASAIEDANRALGAFADTLPYGVGPSSPAGQAMVLIAADLDSYNNGRLAEGC